MNDYLKDVESIGIVGLAKNTGKTTTLNFLIELYKHETLGLTSIGLDGEKIDQVNFLPKPRIKVYPGMVVATSMMCLDQSDVLFETLFETPFNTALGRVVVVLIKTEGYIMLAGPTTNKELNRLLNMIKPYVKRIFVDGALSRMTFSAISELDGIVLSTGASFSEEMSETVKKTKYIINSLNYPISRHVIPDKATLYFKTQNDETSFSTKSVEHLKMTLNKMKHDIQIVYINGAITEKIMDTLVDVRAKNFDLIVDDPTKLLFHHTYADIFDKLGIQVFVKKKCPLRLITINPFRPLGSSYDAKRFMQEIQKLTTIPVINVKHMEVNDGT